MTGPLERVAGAPITWGVCEVPGWGHQPAPERVLEDMRDLGLRATELGPEGFLPTDHARRRALLDTYGLQLVGGFVAVVLHRTERLDDQLDRARRCADDLASTGARVMVLAAATGDEGYEDSRALDDDEWKTLVVAIDEVVAIGAERGLSVAFHPHFGTVIEGPDEVARLLGSSEVPVCLDTGHLLVGGSDPAEVARAARSRVLHVHLKDVDAAMAERLRAGRVSYRDAVGSGMYRPLGQGDVDIAGIVRLLEGAGFEGWYVLEQDAVLDAAPERGRGPVEDAAASLHFIRRVMEETNEGVSARGW